MELSPDDPGGNTVIVSLCPTFMCSVKVNDDLQTRVVQNDPVYAQAGNGVGRGPLVSAPSATEHSASQPAVNLLADDFVYDRFTGSTGTMLPFAYHLPDGYDPSKTYPVVVILPGQGMGFDAGTTKVSRSPRTCRPRRGSSRSGPALTRTSSCSPRRTSASGTLRFRPP